MSATHPVELDRRRESDPVLQAALVTVACWLASAIYLVGVSRAGHLEALLIALAGGLPAGLASAIGIRVTGIKRRAGPSDRDGLAPAEMLAAILREPRLQQRTTFVGGLAPLVAVPVALAAMGFEARLEIGFLRSLVIAVLCAAIVASLLVRASARQRLTAERVALAGACADAGMLGEAPPRRAFATRLAVVVAVPLLAASAMLSDRMGHALRDAALADALVWTERLAAAVAGVDPALPSAERILRGAPARRLWPMATRVEILSTGAAPEGVLADAPRLREALRRALAEDGRQGRLAHSGARRVGAFQKAVDDSVVVVSVASEALGAAPASVWGPLVAAVLLAGAAAFLLARVQASEHAESLSRLEELAARLALGRSAEDIADPAADDLGRLGLALREASLFARADREQTAATAEQIVETVRRVSGILSTIGSSGSARSSQLAQAKGMMEALVDEFARASSAAEELTATIDESNRSVAEVGAAGDELNETASVLGTRVDAVSDSLEQMMRSVKQVAAISDRLAEASEETSSSMEQMASAMRAVDTSAETTARLSRDVVEKAELGQAKVVQTIAGMEAIREATDAAERVIRGLGARTKEIGGILDVIDDVADETNLLALNAAIIAAQAGEQGRAFSVVADEIKELADRVLASTKEIGGLIRAVQEESGNAIGAIEAGSASVMSGVDLSAEAGRTLEEITEASRESGTRIGEIVASVREQTKAASHVVTLMERVRESADRIGEAGAEQERGNEVVYRSALTMREVAQQVRQTAESQTAGLGRIQDYAVGLRGAVGQIAGALREQSETCARVTSLLEGIATDGRASGEAAESLDETLRELLAHAESLRGGAERRRENVRSTNVLDRGR